MAGNKNIFLPVPPNLNEQEGMSLKAYLKPELVELGDLRTVTLGPSIGASDSPADGAWDNGFGKDLPQNISDKLNALSSPEATATPGYPINLP